jgi:undecaprenyl-diphosphatase
VPISSSGHTTLLVWQRRWNHARSDPAARKRLELALHAGSAAALVIGTRHDPPNRHFAMIAAACAPPALAGALLADPIERRLGTPPTIAAGLLAGSLAMVLAERAGRRDRTRHDAGVRDGLAFGAAQTLALIPGVSRSGATRAAARWRGFAPREAEALSRTVGLPITLGAVAFKARELAHVDRREWGPLAAGALAACAAGLLADGALRRGGGSRSLHPYAAYRVAVAAAVIRHLRQNAQR